MEFTEAVPESDIRRIRGGSWFMGGPSMFVPEVDDVMHSSDQFSDLGFRLVTLEIGSSSVPPIGEREGLVFGISGPHPFRDEARFRIELPEAARVRIDVFDLNGRRVPGGIDKALPAGAHEVGWNIDNLPAGVYLARQSAIGRSEVVRFVRLR
jgi:hypothetical protein